ncbi:MAG: hypothetical protein H0Z39_02310 [Peptococcaceae bacterium]|nr:hypothetical protein [Peptococcaceae bacterium]
MLVILLGFAALTVDIGMLVVSKWQMVAAADAAALAGASCLPDTSTARQEAKYYASLNGYSLPDNLISFSENKKITVNLTKNIRFLFGGLIGIPGADVSVSATAEKGGLPRIADYAVFSGSEVSPLTITTDWCVVNGAVHTNDAINVSGNNNVFNGVVEYVDYPVLHWDNGNQYNEGVVQTSVMEIPDYSDQWEALCSPAQIYGEDLTIGDGFRLDGGIWVQGNVTVTADDLDGTGGYILADGDITINGNEGSYLFADDKVCFYSKHGNIYLNGDDLYFRGILYAPEGQVCLTGDRPTIEGSVIGDTISYTEAAHITRDQEVIDAIFSGYGAARLVN